MPTKTNTLKTVLICCILGTGCIQNDRKPTIEVIHRNIDDDSAKDAAAFVEESGVRVRVMADGTLLFPNSSDCENALEHFVNLQNNKLRIVAENLLNEETVKDRSGRNNPYRRRYVQEQPDTDGLVKEDESPFPVYYCPANPVAASDGLIRLPNVDVTTELVIGFRAKRDRDEAERVFQRLHEDSLSETLRSAK